MPRSAYLDANVYNDVERGELAAEDIAATQAAKKSGALTIRLSICDLEEAVFAVCDEDAALALRRLSIMRDLAGFDSLVHQPADWLAMSIRAYATNALRPSPLLPMPQRLNLANRITEAIGNPSRFAAIVSEIVAGVQQAKQNTYKHMAEARRRAIGELNERWTARELGELTFEEYFTARAEGWAEELARPHGLAEACRARGLDGLLKVPAVRLTVGLLLSEIFAQVVYGRRPKGSYAYDLWHAIQASTTSVFVTKDARFAKHMTGIPGAPIVQTVTSLRELLDT